MISLYDSTENNFSHNGLVVLSDCKTAFVEEELNGKYELELEYPIDVRGKWTYLIEESILKADGQLFRIYHKEKTLTGIKVSARHIFYDLLDNFIESCSIGNLNAAGALNAILSNTQYAHGYSSVSDIDVSNTYVIDKQNPVEAILGDNGIIAKYGGELFRDNFNIRLYQARGLDRGVLISYGKNVIGIEETLDMGSVVTRLLPIGKDGLNLPEKYLDSPFLGSYPHPIVKSVEFTDCETVEILRTIGQTYLSQSDKPLVNYSVDFIELTNTDEYKHYSILETVYMGDTVTVRHAKLNIDLKCKVIRIKKNLLTNRIEEVELGSFKPNLALSLNTSIATLSNQQAQDKSDLQAAIDNATLQINSALGGYVVKRNSELLIMDTEDINTATKVWRWNEGGLGYSGTGYNGPFRTAITADGHIVADFIDTGSLTAGIVKTGTLTSKTGKLSIGLDDEVLNIGGKIVYNGATGQVTFAPDVILSWDNIGNKPAFAPSDADNTAEQLLGNGFTKIGSNYIYTGTLSAEQVNSILVEGVNIVATDSLEVRSTDHTRSELEFSIDNSVSPPTIVKVSPVNSGAQSHDMDIVIACNDSSQGSFNVFGTGGRNVVSMFAGDLYVNGGAPNSLGNIAFHVDKDGNLECRSLSINGVPSSGGGSGGTPPVNTTVTYAANGLGLTTVADGVSEVWTLHKDASGRITSMTSDKGRTYTIAY